MSNERPNVNVVYQSAPSSPMGCMEAVVSLIALVIFGIVLAGGLWWL